MKKILGAEAVSLGHPDKVADQISDAILDAYLTQDPKARVACETTITPGRVILAGEITSVAEVDLEACVRTVLKRVGYNETTDGIESSSCKVEAYISQQSPDIAQAVMPGAGDQGIMIGYATDETPAYMPLPVVIAHQLIEALRKERECGGKPFLGPDAKVLVQVAYEGFLPRYIDSLILSVQHTEKITLEELRCQLALFIKREIPAHLITATTRLFLNPAGRFVIGGPKADAGMTGRKQLVDSYGSVVPHGGGAFSGKDATKVDRSGAYLARYIAKNIVAAKLAKRCEVSLTYAIGLAEPITLQIDTFGTSQHSLEELVRKSFALDVPGLITMLDLERPRFVKTAYGGHFGRNDPDFTWEQTDKVAAFREHL